MDPRFNVPNVEHLEWILSEVWELKEVENEVWENYKILKEISKGKRMQLRKLKKVIRDIEKEIAFKKRLERKWNNEIEEMIKLSEKKLKLWIETVNRDYDSFIKNHFPIMYGYKTKPTFLFIDVYRDKYKTELGIGIEWLCEHLKTRDTSYYKWVRQGKNMDRRINYDALVYTFEIWMRWKGLVGRESIWDYWGDDVEAGLTSIKRPSETTIYQYMRILGICSLVKEWNKNKESDNKYIIQNPKIKNELRETFIGRDYQIVSYCNWKTKRPFEKLSMDETMIKMRDGSDWWLSLIKDKHTGLLIGYAFDKRNNTNLALRSLGMALENHDLSGSILHTDRASWYGSSKFMKYCKNKNITQSMNDVKDPTQNFPIEKGNDLIKNELLKFIPLDLRTPEFIKNELDSYIEQYNYIRKQKQKGWDKKYTPWNYYQFHEGVQN